MALSPALTERRIPLLTTVLVFAAVLAALVVEDRGHPGAPDAADLRTAPGAAVLALTGPHPMDAVAELRDARTTLGYSPVVVDGHPANPHGGCSSPVPMPTRFEPLCAVHDLGYDLLRWAARSGHPLGPWARLRLDGELVAAMRRSCHDPTCAAAADLARVGLMVNTWRQHDGVPVVEDTRAIISSVLVRIVETADR
ncbi:MAG: hypothetical protein PGN29_16360 [Gordonia paraffinivorans]